jgi:hypothetical protein
MRKNKIRADQKSIELPECDEEEWFAARARTRSTILLVPMSLADCCSGGCDAFSARRTPPPANFSPSHINALLPTRRSLSVKG